MAIRLSTGLRQSLLTTSGFLFLMNPGYIKLYSGSQPATADAAATGTLLAVTGSFSVGVTPDGKVVGNTPITMYVVTAGTCGWFRWYSSLYPGDSGGASTIFPRVDGSIPENLVLSSTSVTPLSPIVIDQLELTFPNEA